MYTSGIIILLICLISIGLLIFFHKQIRFYINHYYIILSVFALFILIYFICARYSLDVQSYLSYKNDYNSIYRSMYLSKILLLDMCPLMAFLLPITSIFKKTRKISLIFSPITIIGSSITIFGQIIFENVNMDQFAQYLFLGIGLNRMYFMMHFLTLILAIIILIINYKFNYRDCIYTFLFYLLWVFYVSLCTSSLDIKCNASGMVAYDWISPYGQYHKVYLIWPLAYPQIMFFWYFVVVFVNALIIFIKNVLTKKINNEEMKKIYQCKNINYWSLFKLFVNKYKKLD